MRLKRFKYIVCFYIATQICYAQSIVDIEQQCLKSQCRGVVDAGSSGSRFYIYARDLAVSPSQWQLLWEQKINPSLAEVSIEMIDKYLNRLFQSEMSIPMQVQFYGTAGMRLLSQSEQDLRYEAVKAWFLKHPQWNLTEIRTISGQEEGVFAWLAAQEELHKLDKGTGDLTAMIEIGGASAQVTIPISSFEYSNYQPEDVYVLHLADQTVYLWSKSYLGFGINEVEKKAKHLLSCFTVGYPIAVGEVGQGDVAQCITQLEAQHELSILDRLHEVKSIVQQHPNLTWVGLGVLKYTALAEPYHFANSYFDLKALREQGDNIFCHTHWDILSDQYFSDPFLYRQCFAVGYLYSYLVDGMGLNDDLSIYYPRQNELMDWTLGVLLLDK